MMSIELKKLSFYSSNKVAYTFNLIHLTNVLD